MTSSSSSLLQTCVSVAILFTQIVSLIAGLVLLKFIRNENKVDVFNVLLLSMTIGLLIFDASFIIFDYIDIYDTSISWLYIIATVISVYAYFIGSLLSYSIYKLLLYKSFIKWDYKSTDHRIIIAVCIITMLICLILGAFQFYTPIFEADGDKQYTPLPLASMLLKLAFSTFSLICHALCKYTLIKDYDPTVDKADKIKQQLRKLRMFPLLQLLCIVPLFIAGVTNNFFIVPPCDFMKISPVSKHFHTSDNMWVAFGISYVFLFADLLFMLLVYMSVNKVPLNLLIEVFFSIFPFSKENKSDQLTIEDAATGTSAITEGEDMNFSLYHASSTISKASFSDYTIENPMSPDSISSHSLSGGEFISDLSSVADNNNTSSSYKKNSRDLRKMSAAGLLATSEDSSGIGSPAKGEKNTLQMELVDVSRKSQS